MWFFGFLVWFGCSSLFSSRLPWTMAPKKGGVNEKVRAPGVSLSITYAAADYCPSILTPISDVRNCFDAI